MTETTEKDLTDSFTEALDSAAAALADEDERLDAETADSLRAHLADLSSDVDDASVSDLLAAAGVSAGDVETTDGDAGTEDEDGELTNLPRLLASADDETVDSLRTLLDLADLGEDAPEDDAAFTERLDAILGDAGTADDAGTAADDAKQTAGDTEETDSGGEEVDADAEEAAVDESDARSEDADESDGQPTVADVVSKSVSFARDWRDARRGVVGDDEADADAEDGKSDADAEDGESDADDADEDDEGWFDFDDLTPEVEEEGGRSGSQRGGRGTRFSTLPGRRSDMERAGRFSSIKGRK